MMAYKSLKVRKTVFSDIFVLLAWIAPTRILNLIPSSQYFLFIFRLIIVFVLCKKRNWQLPKFQREEIWAFLFIISGLPGMILTGLNDIGSYLWYLCDLINIFSIYLFFSTGEHAQYKFLHLTKWVWLVLLLLSFYYGAIMDWGGAYGNKIFFIGGKDATVQCLTMFYAFAVFYDKKYKLRIQITTIILAILSILFAYIYDSGLGMVMIGCMIIIYTFGGMFGKRIHKFPLPLMTITGLVFIYYLIISLKYMNIPWVVFIIEKVLKKDITLTGRAWIYTECLCLIAKRIVFGYGYGNTIVSDTLGQVFVAYNSAHNSFLQILIDNGIIGLFLFILMFYYGIKRMLKVQSVAVMSIYISLVVMCIGGLTGRIIPSTYFWIVFILGLCQKNCKNYSWA